MVKVSGSFGVVGALKYIASVLGFDFFFVNQAVTESDDAGLVTDGTITETIDAGNV